MKCVTRPLFQFARSRAFGGRHGGLVVMVILAMTKVAAQFEPVPYTSVSITKESSIVQSSATAAEDRGSMITIRVVFRDITVPPIYSLELRGSSISIEIPKLTTTQFVYSKQFADIAAMDRALPDGIYSLVTWNAAIPVLVATGTTVADARIANFDALQRWGGEYNLSITAAPTTAGSAASRVLLYLYKDGAERYYDNVVVSSPSTTIRTFTELPYTAPGESLRAQLRFQNSSSTPIAGGLVGVYRMHTLEFSVARAHLPPTITRNPSAQSVTAGTTVALSVAATGNALSYLWRKDAVPLLGATNATLSLPATQPSDSGVYSAIVSNTGGTVVSSEARLTVIQPTFAPVITLAPAGKSLTAGESHTFNVSATGTPPLSYQWARNGVPIAGATSTSLRVEPARFADTGNYTVVVTNGTGSLTSGAANLLVNPVSRISNLSIRSLIGAESGTLTVGLTIGGTGTTGSKPLLLRAVGPTLAIFGVTGALADPQLALLSGQSVIAQNDDWTGDSRVTQTSATVGAFELVSDASKDAALAQSAETGGYTVRVSGAATSTGVALTEVYDATPSNAFLVGTPRLTNVSALTRVGTGGDILIAGFSITGSSPTTLLVRGIGPTLRTFGVTDALTDPKLELFAAGTTPATASNDNWGDANNAAQMASIATAVGAFVLASDSKDASLLVTLGPGSYTVHVSGGNNTAGNALVEVYEVP